MKFYFIYSAGGGAGDWNGVKRAWRDRMPEYMKNIIKVRGCISGTCICTKNDSSAALEENT